MTNIRIMQEIATFATTDSLRDRAARKLISENVRISKRGHYFIVNLFGNELKIHHNCKYISRMVHDFLWRDCDVYGAAKQVVKQYFAR